MMTTATMATNLLAGALKPGAELGLRYAESLVKTISAETFSHMPGPVAGVTPDALHSINSPAFNLGHLAIYPDLRILPLLGRDDLVRPLPFSSDLFKAGAPCLDQPGLYPAKDVIVATYNDRYRAAIAALDSVSDEHLAKPNPMEGRMREVFPTIGAAIAFLLVGHPQSHLGQISVWRRVMGLGSAL